MVNVNNPDPPITPSFNTNADKKGNETITIKGINVTTNTNAKTVTNNTTCNSLTETRQVNTNFRSNLTVGKNTVNDPHISIIEEISPYVFQNKITDNTTDHITDINFGNASQKIGNISNYSQNFGSKNDEGKFFFPFLFSAFYIESIMKK